ncbi:MAG TPA: hypothetical protein VFT67_11215 [Jatrophihabitantaceae bacterium]|nr:hypothetical protein [Jatrophihabitantaceae bacterium]
MTNSTMELRAALRLLADEAPAVEALDHTAWSGQPGGQRPRRRLQMAAIAATVAVVAALVAGTQLIHHNHHATAPASSGRAVLEVRPLVAPGVLVLPAGARPSNLLQSLPFPIPRTAADYSRLDSARQRLLRTALTMTDCTHPTASTAVTRVACGPTLGGHQTAYLLGPSLFGHAGIKSATEVAPSPKIGETQWTVALQLRAPAAAAFGRFTTAHHTSDFVAHGATQCGVGSAPCGDYLGFVVNGSVVSIPLTMAPINGGTIQISGNFDKQSATTLAQQLNP